MTPCIAIIESDVLAAAAAQDYKKYYATEILLRKAMIYPPYCDLCLIGFSGEQKQLVADCAAALAQSAKQKSSARKLRIGFQESICKMLKFNLMGDLPREARERR